MLAKVGVKVGRRHVFDNVREDLVGVVDTEHRLLEQGVALDQLLAKARDERVLHDVFADTDRLHLLLVHAFEDVSVLGERHFAVQLVGVPRRPHETTVFDALMREPVVNVVVPDAGPVLQRNVVEHQIHVGVLLIPRLARRKPGLAQIQPIHLIQLEETT